MCPDQDGAPVRLRFHIQSWGAWAPGLETQAAWFAWAGRTDTPPNSDDSTTSPPVLLRRRVTHVGQHALRIAWSLPDIATSRIVFCSRHGEFGRTLSILNALCGAGPVSPADFTLSVHNALAGLLSIAASNRRGHTTIAAGEESFACGMMEALSCLADDPDEPILLVYFDDRLPSPFDVFTPSTRHGIAIALAMTAHDGEAFTLATATAPHAISPDPDPAMRFMRFMLGTEAELTMIGDRLSWQWRRDDRDC